MKYFYINQNLFGSTWVECGVKEYDSLTMEGIATRYESDTPLKDAVMNMLKDSTPSIVSDFFDELLSESDFEMSQAEVEYYIDEELINPDYDDKLEFDDGDALSSDSVGSSKHAADSSSSTNSWFPNAAISIPDHKVTAEDIKRVQRAIFTLMENGMVKESDELDGNKFVKRLETFRNVKIDTHQKNRANPSILFMPDFSPSCVSYAQLYNTLLESVSAIRDDFNVLSAPHFNGLPSWFVVNGKKETKPMEMYSQDFVKFDLSWGDVTETEDAQRFYAAAIGARCSLYNISTVIIAGDMDGVWCYKLLLDNSLVENVIWVDG